MQINDFVNDFVHEFATCTNATDLGSHLPSSNRKKVCGSICKAFDNKPCPFATDA
jgi:hypothetical protein